MTVSRELDITNKRGLHARASAKFVKCVEAFASEVTVSHDGQTVPGTSILGLMMLAAANGSTIKVIVDGPDEDAAMHAIVELLQDRFGEDRDDEEST